MPGIVQTECGGGQWEVISRPGGSDGVGGEAGGVESSGMGAVPPAPPPVPPFLSSDYSVNLFDFVLLMLFWLPLLSLSGWTLFCFMQ